MASYRLRRALVLDRRERRAKVEQLKRDVRTWDWWSFVLTARVLPLCLAVFLGWSFGFINGASWTAQEIEARFACEAKHAD